MQITSKFKEITDSLTIDEAYLTGYLSSLYGNEDYNKIHKSYKNQEIGYEDENTILNENIQREYSLKLIDEIAKLSQKDKFLELKAIFQNNVSPGVMRITLCLIKEALEAISYRLEKKLSYSKTLFDIQLANSSFNVCFPGILTHITSLLQVMSDDFYSMKFGYLKAYTKEYLKNITYDEIYDTHIVNWLLYSITDIYNINIPEDFIDPEIPHSIFESFKTDITWHLNSKEGCYSFISYLSTIYDIKLQQYKDVEIKYGEDSMNELETIISNIGASMPSVLEYNLNSDNECIITLKPNLEDLLTVSLTKKLIIEGMIEHELLCFNDGIVVQTPLGWYMTRCKSINDPVEDIAKLIDYKDLKGLCINGYDMEYILFTLLKDLNDKSCKDALITILKHNDLGDDFDESTIGKKLFLLSGAGLVFLSCFSSYQEVLSLKDEEFYSWKDLLTSINPIQHLYEIIQTESFEPFIINKNITPTSIKLLMEHTNKTLLHIAVIISNIRLANLLLGYYVNSEPICDKNHLDANGDTALNIAISAKDIKMIKLLLNSYVRIDIRNLDCKTAVQLAIDTNDINVVSIILESINNNIKDIKDIKGNKMLQYAIQENSDIDIIKLLMDCKYMDINSKNLEGKTAMHLAVRHKNSYEIIKMLIEREAEISFDIVGRTPLFYSALLNNIDAINPLITVIKKNWSYDDAEEELLSVLFKIIESSESIESIEKILSFFDISTLNKCNKNGENLIHIAIFNKTLCLDIITLLHHKYGLNCNVKDKYLNTPLHDACFNGNTESIVALLKIDGIEINPINQEGNTPLHALMDSTGFKIETLDLLLKKGANQEIKNKDDKKPIDILALNSQIKKEGFICEINRVLSMYQEECDKKRPLEINSNTDSTPNKVNRIAREESYTYIPDQNIEPPSIVISSSINMPINLNMPTKSNPSSMSLQR